MRRGSQRAFHRESGYQAGDGIAVPDAAGRSASEIHAERGDVADHECDAAREIHVRPLSPPQTPAGTGQPHAGGGVMARRHHSDEDTGAAKQCEQKDAPKMGIAARRTPQRAKNSVGNVLRRR